MKICPKCGKKIYSTDNWYYTANICKKCFSSEYNKKYLSIVNFNSVMTNIKNNFKKINIQLKQIRDLYARLNQLSERILIIEKSLSTHSSGKSRVHKSPKYEAEVNRQNKEALESLNRCFKK